MSRVEFTDWRLNRKARHLPAGIRQQCRQHPLLTTLFVGSVGHIVRGLGHHYERHSIDEYILLYCVEGRGWIRSGDQAHGVQVGDVAVVFARTAHGYGADDADPWTIHWTHFDGSQVPPFLEAAGLSPQRPVIHLPNHGRSSLVQAFQAIHALLNVDLSFPYLLHASVLLRQILSTLILVAATVPEPAPSGRPVQKAVQFMQANITETLRLEDLALWSGLSPSHFHRVFRAATGRAPIDYFIRLKIQRACELLANTDMKVSEIGQFLGYRDAHYFSRLFKQVTGHSPRAFRTACRNGHPPFDEHALLAPTAAGGQPHE